MGIWLSQLVDGYSYLQLYWLLQTGHAAVTLAYRCLTGRSSIDAVGSSSPTEHQTLGWLEFKRQSVALWCLLYKNRLNSRPTFLMYNVQWNFAVERAITFTCKICTKAVNHSVNRQYCHVIVTSCLCSMCSDVKYMLHGQSITCQLTSNSRGVELVR